MNLVALQRNVERWGVLQQNAKLADDRFERIGHFGFNSVTSLWVRAIFPDPRYLRERV